MAPRHPSRSCQSPSRTGANATYPFAGGCFIEGRANRPGPMPMLTFWLDQPIWLIFGSLACLVLAWCLMLITLTNTKRTRPLHRRCLDRHRSRLRRRGLGPALAPDWLCRQRCLGASAPGVPRGTDGERPGACRLQSEPIRIQGPAGVPQSARGLHQVDRRRGMARHGERWKGVVTGRPCLRKTASGGGGAEFRRSRRESQPFGPCSRRCSTCRPRAAKGSP